MSAVDRVPLRPDGDMDVYWNDLPAGTKEYFERNTGSNVLAFIIGMNMYFNIDKEYNWELLKTLRASNLLAADFY